MKISNFGGNTQPPFQKKSKKTVLTAVKKDAKTDIKLFQSCPIFLHFLTLLQIFCLGLQSIEKVLEDIQCYVFFHVTNNLANLFC